MLRCFRFFSQKSRLPDGFPIQIPLHNIQNALESDGKSLSDFVGASSRAAFAASPAAAPSLDSVAQAAANGTPRTYYLETYGCQMNTADSEIVHSILQGASLTRTDDVATAGVILINTCAIREHAEQKAWVFPCEALDADSLGGTGLVASRLLSQSEARGENQQQAPHAPPTDASHRCTRCRASKMSALCLALGQSPLSSSPPPSSLLCPPFSFQAAWRSA